MSVWVLVAGGTGLVGGHVVQKLLARDVMLVSLVRQGQGPFERVIDFEMLIEDLDVIGPGSFDVAVSCLGTTIRKAGSREAFRRVDHDYVLAFARAARRRGARQFILISAAGASGPGFYLGVKGEIEAAVCALDFERVDLIRPGLLLGSREERRPLERLAQHLAPVLNPLLVGSLSDYAAIPAESVACAIDRLVSADEAGVFIHHHRELRR